MTAHRYWRINVTGTLTTGGVQPLINEIEMRTSIGGSNVCSGGTPADSSHYTGNEAAKAFDASDGTYWEATGNCPQWVSYDFGSGNDKSIVEVHLRSWGAFGGYLPSTFDVQWSDDNSSWTTQWSVGSGDTSGWDSAPDTWKTFTDPSAPLTGTLGATDVPDAGGIAATVEWAGALAATDVPDVGAFAALTPATATLAATEPTDAGSFQEHVLQAAHAADFVPASPRFGTPVAREIINYVVHAVGFVPASPRFGEPVAEVVTAIPPATDFVPSSPVFGTPAAAIEPTHLTPAPPVFGTPRAWMHVDAPAPIDFISSSPRFGTPYAKQIISTLIKGAFLPENIEKNAKGGPAFNTSIFSGSDGTEYRSINWIRQLGRWSIVLGFREEGDEDLDAMRSVFYAARGRAFGFLFKDWSDYWAEDELMAAIPSSSLFQLQKTYSIGQGSYVRKITRPKSGTVVIKNGDGSPAVGVTVNYEDGTVMGANADMTASFNFYVPVRFDMDVLHMNVEHDGLINVEAIDLVEILE